MGSLTTGSSCAALRCTKHSPEITLGTYYCHGIRRITSHGLRHTAGTSYAAMGAGNRNIASLLGHADMRSTERYTHAVTDGLGALVEARWDKMRGGQDV